MTLPGEAQNSEAEMLEAKTAKAETPKAGASEARTLWRAALRLDRAARAVSVSSRTRPPLLFFTDPVRTPEPWTTAARLPKGAGVVYRHFGAADAEAIARHLRAVTARQGVVLLIGLDADLAKRVGADGVHLPERALQKGADLRRDHPDWLLTGALHDPARGPAGADAFDALVLSPVFSAGGVSSAKTALGISALDIAWRTTGRPIYALGGVTAVTAAALDGSGACGLAGVDAIARAFT